MLLAMLFLQKIVSELGKGADTIIEDTVNMIANEDISNFHPKSICKEYERHQKCERKECAERHPKSCKWRLFK